MELMSSRIVFRSVLSPYPTAFCCPIALQAEGAWRFGHIGQRGKSPLAQKRYHCHHLSSDRVQIVTYEEASAPPMKLVMFA
jgi:hypothetical protein